MTIMKKTTILFAIALLAATTSFAQKGSVLLGGDLVFSTEKYPSPVSSSELTFSLAPVVGYQFSNAWTAGLVLGYTYNQLKNAGNTTHSSNAYTVGPFVRYTRALTSWVSVYGQFQATREDEGKISTDAGGVPRDTYIGDIQLFPALFFNVKNGFGLNLSFGGLEGSLTHISHVGTFEENATVTFGNSILIGVSKNFGGRHKAS
jgi:hypothetical protein